MTTTSKIETALDRFISRTRDVFHREEDLEKRWTTLAPILAELLSDEKVVEASRKWPYVHVVDNRAENLLFYENPDYRFVINAVVHSGTRRGGLADPSGGPPSRAHDHAHIYTLYGLLDGHQRVERFERLDDGTKPDYAQIRLISDNECGPGEIDLVRPYEIHAEHTRGERAAAIIVRSEKSGGFLQGRYSPESGRFWQGYGPRQTTISFY